MHRLYSIASQPGQFRNVTLKSFNHVNSVRLTMLISWPSTWEKQPYTCYVCTFVLYRLGLNKKIIPLKAKFILVFRVGADKRRNVFNICNMYPSVLTFQQPGISFIRKSAFKEWKMGICHGRVISYVKKNNGFV